MYNSIIISFCLFGSIYIFSDSLKLLNNSFLKNTENTKITSHLIIIDSLICILSGSIIIYSINFLVK